MVFNARLLKWWGLLFIRPWRFLISTIDLVYVFDPLHGFPYPLLSLLWGQTLLLKRLVQSFIKFLRRMKFVEFRAVQVALVDVRIWFPLLKNCHVCFGSRNRPMLNQIFFVFGLLKVMLGRLKWRLSRLRNESLLESVGVVLSLEDGLRCRYLRSVDVFDHMILSR